MHDWLNRNRVYFETLGQALPGLIAIAISIMAIVISVDANRTQRESVKLTRLQALPRFSFREGYGDNRSRQIMIFNYGSTITDVTFDAHPAITVECLPSRPGKTKSIVWDLSHVFPLATDNYSAPTGEVNSLEWDQLDLFFRKAIDALYASGSTLGVLNATESYYIAIHYRDALGMKGTSFYHISFDRSDLLSLDAWRRRFQNSVQDVWEWERDRRGGPIREGKARVAEQCRAAYGG